MSFCHLHLTKRNHAGRLDGELSRERDLLVESTMHHCVLECPRGQPFRVSAIRALSEKHIPARRRLLLALVLVFLTRPSIPNSISDVALQTIRNPTYPGDSSNAYSLTALGASTNGNDLVTVHMWKYMTVVSVRGKVFSGRAWPTVLRLVGTRLVEAPPHFKTSKSPSIVTEAESP